MRDYLCESLNDYAPYALLKKANNNLDEHSRVTRDPTTIFEQERIFSS
jgi:hypothetical protein